MSGRGPVPCRFGVDCHRKDCWYSHPAGRAIDAGGGGGGGGNSGSNGASGATGAAGSVGGGGGGMRLGTTPGGGGMMPQPSSRMGGGDGSSGGGGGGGGGKECRYAYECKRQNCHFSHPFGERTMEREHRDASIGAGWADRVLRKERQALSLCCPRFFSERFFFFCCSCLRVQPFLHSLHLRASTAATPQRTPLCCKQAFSRAPVSVYFAEGVN